MALARLSESMAIKAAVAYQIPGLRYLSCSVPHAGKLEGASLSVYYKPSNAEADAKVLGKVLVDTKVCGHTHHLRPLFMSVHTHMYTQDLFSQ